MKKINLFGLMVGILIMLNSCSSPNLFTPNMIHAPLLEKEGDYSGQIGTVTDGGVPTLELQIAHGMTNNFAGMANYSFRKHRNEQNSRSFTHQLAEIGGGYYAAFGKEDNKLIRISTFGGAGRGWSSGFSNFEPNYHSYKANYMKFFLQTTFGISMKNFEAAFSNRLSSIQFTEFSHRLNDQLQSGGPPQYSLIEPFFTVKAGAPHFKFVIQAGYVFASNTSNSNFNSAFLDKRDLIGLQFIDDYFVRLGLEWKINFERENNVSSNFLKI